MVGLIHSPQGVHAVNLNGLGVVYRLSGLDTADAFVVLEHPLEPRTLGSPVHTHTHEDEYSYILEGEVMVKIGDEVFTATAGDWVCKPRGIPHAFWNASTAPARILEIITPPGFEGYFDEMSALAAARPIDIQRIGEVQQKYGLVSDPTSIQELCQKYNLRLEDRPPVEGK